jgi:hypothetical protein
MFDLGKIIALKNAKINLIKHIADNTTCAHRFPFNN